MKSGFQDNQAQETAKDITKILKIWEEFEITDVDLWDTFKKDFEGYSEDDFKLISKHDLWELRAFLRKRGVWVEKSRLSITKSLFNTLQEQEPTPWTESEVKQWNDIEQFTCNHIDYLFKTDFGRKPLYSWDCSPRSSAPPPPKLSSSNSPPPERLRPPIRQTFDPPAPPSNSPPTARLHPPIRQTPAPPAPPSISPAPARKLRVRRPAQPTPTPAPAYPVLPPVKRPAQLTLATATTTSGQLVQAKPPLASPLKLSSSNSPPLEPPHPPVRRTPALPADIRLTPEIPEPPPTTPNSTSATPLSSSSEFLAPATLPASTATPTSSYAAIAGRHALPTPLTTPKITKPTFASPKPAYMTMEDLFRKFAGKTSSRPLKTVTPLELRPRSSQTLPTRTTLVAGQPRRQQPQPQGLRPQVDGFHTDNVGAKQELEKATGYNSQGRPWEQRKCRARPSKSAPEVKTYSRLAATYHSFFSLAVSVWEWTWQFGLRLRAWGYSKKEIRQRFA